MAIYDTTASLGAFARLDTSDSRIGAEYIYGNTGPDQLPDSGVEYVHGNTTPITSDLIGVEYVHGNTTPITSDLIGVEYVYGLVETTLSAIGSMTVGASTITYIGSGTSGTGTTSISVGYPSNSTANRLVILGAGMKKHTDKLSNTNFRRAGWTTEMPPYEYEKDANRASNNNSLGTDLGPTRTEHHIRYLTSTASGSETFTNSGSTNLAVAGQMHLFSKSGAEEWVIKSYGQFDGGYEHSSVGSSTKALYLYPTSQIKLTTQPILGVANNPGICTLAIATTQLWKTVSGWEWNQLTYPFGTDSAQRIRYGNGVFVAIAANGKVGRSTDNGSSWSVSQPLGSGFTWRGLRYYNNRWIAVGDGGRLMTSDDDGQNWTQRTSGLSTTIYDVAWGKGMGVFSNETQTWSLQPWNSGNGMWWFAAANYRMFRSNDNGSTWSEGAYDTVSNVPWNDSWFNQWSPRAISFTSAASTYNVFTTVGSNLGDYFDAGWYQNTYVYGSWDSTDSWWSTSLAGYSSHFLYHGEWINDFLGRFAYAYDLSALIATNGWSVAWWAYASSEHNGIAIGQSETQALPTNRPYDMVEYCIEHQRLGAPYIEFPVAPPGSGWETYQTGVADKYFFRDGGTWSIIKGLSNGEIRIEEVRAWKNEGEYNETRYSYYDGLDLRVGDLLFVTVTASNSNDTLSNIKVASYNPMTGAYDEYIKFTSMVDIGTITNTSGDRVKVYSGYCYVLSGDTLPVFAEDTFYGTSNPSHWVMTQPTIQVTFNVTASVIARSAYTTVLTVVRSQIFGVDMLATASMSASATVRKTGVEPGSPGADYVASMTVDAYVENSPDPWLLGYGYSYNEINNNGVSRTFGYNLPAGTLVVAYVIADNLSATTPTITVTDGSSNTYTELGFKGQNASAKAGVVGGIYYSILTTAVTSSTYLTATLSGAVDCKALAYYAWRNAGKDGLRSTTVTASGSSATPTVTSGTVNTGDLVVALAGIENSTTPTADSDTLNGTWYNQIAATGSGGNAATHLSIYAAHKYVTGSGAQTFNPATSPSTDWIEIIGVFANAPKVYSALYARATGSMSVNLEVVKTGTSTVVGAGSVTAIGERMGNGSTVIGVGTVTADSKEIYSANVTGTGTVDAFGSAGSRASVSGAGSVTAKATTATTATAEGAGSVTGLNTIAVTAEPVIGAGYTIGSRVYDTTVLPMEAVAEAVGAGPYVIAGTNPSNPDDDAQPVIDSPETLPGTDGWFLSSSSYGNTGRTGNLLELTNRHYQDAYRAACEWEDWPFPNGPGGFWGMGYLGTYTLGARSAAVTPLGDDRFLVTWTQENWVQYYLDWTVWGDPIQRVLMDVPMILVATILDCSGDGDPVITGTKRYDMPLSWRWYRNGYGQSAQPMGNGKVACTFSGFMIIPDDWSFDYGTIDTITTGSANIVCVVDASGDVPSFSWVKTFGGYWNGHHSFINEIMIHDNDVLVTRYGYVGASVAKFSGSNGSYIGSSTAISNVADSPTGRASCLYEGNYGYLICDNGYLFVYRRINLSTLAWDDLEDLKYNGVTVNPANYLYRCKQGPDGKWYAAGTTSDSGAYSVFRFNISSGNLTIEGIHRSSVPNVNSYDESSLEPYGNAYRTANWIETWVPINYVNNTALYSLYTKQNFCPGMQNPSVVGTAYYITTMSQYPEHQKGPQVVAGIPEMDESMVPMNPKSWISYPSGEDKSNWSHYFADGRPEFVSDIDCAELSNGRILVVMAGVEDLLDAGEDASGNGIYRIFAYVADPKADPPPLKLSQRDDGKMVGGDRIAYDSENSGDIRAGRIAW